MTSWQKRARIGLAIFGVVVAAIVYRSIGERRAPAPTAPVQRQDKKATVETTAGESQQGRQTQKDFEIEFEVLVVFLRHQEADDRAGRGLRCAIGKAPVGVAPRFETIEAFGEEIL